MKRYTFIAINPWFFYTALLIMVEFDDSELYTYSSSGSCWCPDDGQLENTYVEIYDYPDYGDHTPML